MSSQPAEDPDRAGDNGLIGRSLCYVVLRHEGVATPHFDLLFEWDVGDPLTSFRCPAWPPRVGDAWDEIADHRRDYLHYEGPISGGRGHVERVRTGTLDREVLAIDPPTLALRANVAVVIVQRMDVGPAAWMVESVGE